MAVHMPSPCLVSAGSSQIGRAARQRLHPRSRPRLFPHVPGLPAGRRSVLALGSERQGPARVAAARPWALSPPHPHESLGGDTAVPSPGSAGRGAAGCLSSRHQGPGVEPAHGCSPSEGNLWVGHVPGLALPREGPSLEAPQQGRGVGPPAPQPWASYEEVNSRCLQEPPSHGLRASCAAGGLSMGLPITRKSVPSDQHPTPQRPAA